MRRNIFAAIAIVVLVCIFVYALIVPTSNKATSGQITWDSKADFESNASTTGEDTTRGNVDVSSDGKVTLDDIDSDFKAQEDFIIDFTARSDMATDNLGNYIITRSDGASIDIDKYNSSNIKVIDDLQIYNGTVSSKASIESDLFGNYIITWGASNNIYSLKIDNSGNIVIPAFQVNTIGATYDNNHNCPKVTVALNGSFIIAYRRSNGLDIYAKKFNSSGAVLINEFKVSDVGGVSSSYALQVAVDSSDNIITSWSNIISGEYNVYYKKFDSGGSVIVSDTRLNEDSDNRDAYSKIKVDSQDNYYIAWRRWHYATYAFESNAEIFLRKYDSSDEIVYTDNTITEDITREIMLSSELQISLDDNDNFYIGWENNDAYSDIETNVKKYIGDISATAPQNYSDYTWPMDLETLASGDYLFVFYDGSDYDASVFNGDYATQGGINKLKVDAGAGNKYDWKKIKWDAEKPDGTSIKVRLRRANTESELETAQWSHFYNASGTDISDSVDDSRYLELEVALVSSDGDSPELDSVTVEYSQSSGYEIKTWNSQDDFNEGTLSFVNTTIDGKVKLDNTVDETLDFESSGDDATNAKYGEAIASGDFDNDGYSDSIVGAYYLNFGAGKAYVYSGGPTGLSTTPSGTSVGDNQAGSFFGWAVTVLDANNDGYDDAVVGAYNYSMDEEPWTSVIGKVYLYLGGPVGLSATADWTSTGDTVEFECFGEHISSAGDVNNDGYDDLIIGSTPSYSNPGKTYLYLGQASGLASNYSWSTTAQYYGWSVSSAGDVNNDGYDDVLIGDCNYEYWNGDGNAYLFYGNSYGLSSTHDWTSSGDPDGVDEDFFGNAVSSAGDVNNDGYDDVIIGAPNYNFHDGWYWPGKAYVYFGSSNGLSESADWTAIGDDISFGNLLGYSVSTAGDVNNDGYDDVIIGSPAFYDNGISTMTGKAYLFLGGASALSESSAWESQGDEQGNCQFGRDVSSAGDINNDNYDDVLVGASLFDTANSNAGKVYSYLSSESSNYLAEGNIMGLTISSGNENAASWKNINWTATTPALTGVKFKVRTADTRPGLNSASWSEDIADAEKDYENNLSTLVEKSKWLEISAYLLTGDESSTPELDNITVNYEILESENSECFSCHSEKLPSDEFNRYFENNRVTSDKCLTCHDNLEGDAWHDEELLMYSNNFMEQSDFDFDNPRTVMKIHQVHGASPQCGQCHTGASCITCHISPAHASHGSVNGVAETYSNGTGTYQDTLTCTNEDCHSSIKLQDFVARPSCSNCHYQDVTNRIDKFIEQDGHGNLGQKHTTTLDSTCLECHTQTNVADYHETLGKDCDSCHESTNSRVIYSIRRNDPRCTSDCHRDYHSQEEESHSISISSRCTRCHDGNIAKEHQDRNESCDVCHKDSEDLSNVDCSTCHETFSTHESNECSKCHSSSYDSCTNCHVKETHVGEVSCTSCHLDRFDAHHSNISVVKNCIDCHSDVTHSPGNANSTCLLCHENAQHSVNVSMGALMLSKDSKYNIDKVLNFGDKYSLEGLNSADSDSKKSPPINTIILIVISAITAFTIFGGLGLYLYKRISK